MPEFSKPFVVKNSHEKLNKEELIRAIRLSIADEFEAIQLYDQIASSTDNKDVIKILEEISDDEKVHVGNFLKLLYILNPVEKELYKEGYQETIDLLGLKEDKKEN